MNCAAAELVRIKYQYRRLVVTGRLRLPAAAARPLVGPDCAYHLYGRTARNCHAPRANAPARA